MKTNTNYYIATKNIRLPYSHAIGGAYKTQYAAKKALKRALSLHIEGTIGIILVGKSRFSAEDLEYIR